MYGHFLPSEYTGYEDALSRPPEAPDAHPDPLVPASIGDDRGASSTSGAGFRLPIVGDDAQIPYAIVNLDHERMVRLDLRFHMETGGGRIRKSRD